MISSGVCDKSFTLTGGWLVAFFFIFLIFPGAVSASETGTEDTPTVVVVQSIDCEDFQSMSDTVTVMNESITAIGEDLSDIRAVLRTDLTFSGLWIGIVLPLFMILAFLWWFFKQFLRIY